MTSIIDKDNVYTNFKHFVVDTRSFQIEKARNVEMYDKLRVYIQKQNEKRQQEMEMSAELKRAKREKELKHKRDKSTLDEIREEIAEEENKLKELVVRKDRLFAEFKKVLTEDEARKNMQRAREAAFNNITFSTPNSADLPKPYQSAIVTAPSSHATTSVITSQSSAHLTAPTISLPVTSQPQQQPQQPTFSLNLLPPHLLAAAAQQQQQQQQQKPQLQPPPPQPSPSLQLRRAPTPQGPKPPTPHQPMMLSAKSQLQPQLQQQLQPQSMAGFPPGVSAALASLQAAQAVAAQQSSQQAYDARNRVSMTGKRGHEQSQMQPGPPPGHIQLPNGTYIQTQSRPPSQQPPLQQSPHPPQSQPGLPPGLLHGHPNAGQGMVQAMEQYQQFFAGMHPNLSFLTNPNLPK